VLPSEFPESGAPPKYESADASLWFASDVHQYLQYAGDDAATARAVYGPLLGVVDALRRGTKLGLRTDDDGLLSAGVDGTPVTWMNAKVGSWVVTPRAGKPVELNALWYNALRVVAALADRLGDAPRARELGVLAGNVRISFNLRFWNESAGCCYDVLSGAGNEPAVRPNQLLAASLPFPVLTNDRIARVVDVCRAVLLTPFGLRTLSREHPAYVGHYGGNALARDRAHHNGSVHPWLLGPFVTAFLRASGGGDDGRAEAIELLRPCLDRLRGDGLGQLCELFDGDAPHAPGGAVASAACVGELLRSYVEHGLGVQPGRATEPADVAAIGEVTPASPGIRKR
jgi:predicted glycogen debranching enzyme